MSTSTEVKDKDTGRDVHPLISKDETLYVIDGSGFVFRAYFGLRSQMTAPDGTPVHAVFGFLRLILRLIRDRTPRYLAIAFDPNGPSFRNDIYPEYKANRPDPPEDLKLQYELCVEATQALNIPALTLPKMEADDIIGTLVTQWRKNTQGACVIVTVDKDMAQLVDQDVTLWDGKERETGRDQVIERMGVTPEQVVDLLGLAGDSSDNIPGVPGIGPKTGAKLLKTFQTLEELLTRAHEVKGKRGQSLIQFADQARLSAKLATIKCDAELEVDWDHLRYEGPHLTKIEAFLNRLNFRSILNDLYTKYGYGEQLLSQKAKIDKQREGFHLTSEREGKENTKQTGAQRDQTTETKKTEIKNQTTTIQSTDHSTGEKMIGVQPTLSPILVNRSRYRCILTQEALEEVCTLIRQAGILSFDLETTSLHVHHAEILGVALAWGENEAAYIPIDHYYLGAPQQLEAQWVWSQLSTLLQDEKIPKIGQNIKYERKLLTRFKIKVNGWVGDPMLMSYLLDAGRDHFGLDALSHSLLHHRTLTFKEVAGQKGADDRFAEVEVARATEYAAEDADITLRLYHHLLPQLKAEPQLWTLYQNVELPLTEVLAEMEVRGIILDVDLLKKQNLEVCSTLSDLQRTIHQLAGHPFNIDSPKQLSKVLFDELALKAKGRGKKKKTDKGARSTRQEILEKMRGDHPIISKILEYRHLSKLRSTYLEALPQMIHPKTNRVHTSFKQTGTVTGRLSSSDPNLQNIPLRTAEGRRIREAFISKEGWTLISADYSQVELRLLAHFAQAQQMIDGFKGGADVHSNTAAEIFDCEPSEVSAEQRRAAKAINFGLMYGMGPFKLAETLNISNKEAKEMVERYFERYGEVRAYFQTAVEDARISEMTCTLMGRRRFLPLINRGRGPTRKHAERLAMNTPIQGTAADILKVAMVNLYHKLREEKLETQILLTVHDELVLEAPQHELERAIALTVECMEGACSLSLPLKVEVGSGRHWAEIH